MYKTHDKMIRWGHPGTNPEGVQKLYDEASAANAELERLWNRRPDFYKTEVPLRPEWPSYMAHLRRMFIISFARPVSARTLGFEAQDQEIDARVDSTSLSTGTSSSAASRTTPTPSPG